MPGPPLPLLPVPFDGAAIGAELVTLITDFLDRQLAPVAARLTALEAMVAGLSADTLPPDDAP